MKLLKIVLVVLMFIVNFAVAQPAWADPPRLTNSPEYKEVTQALNDILKAKEAPDRSDYTTEEIERKIGTLQLQKYILETAQNWGQCRNETGKTLAIYAHKPQKSFFPSSTESSLYYLEDGEVTDEEWSCDGILLPSDAKLASSIPGIVSGQQLGEPIALKLVTGSQLVATTNPDGSVKLNIPPAKFFKAGEGNWQIPTLSQADINTKTPNAPVD